MEKGPVPIVKQLSACRRNDCRLSVTGREKIFRQKSICLLTNTSCLCWKQPLLLQMGYTLSECSALPPTELVKIPCCFKLKRFHTQHPYSRGVYGLGFWIRTPGFGFFDPDTCSYLQQDQDGGFLCCSRSWIGFCVLVKKRYCFFAWLIFMRSQAGVGLFVSCWYPIRVGLKICKIDLDLDSKNQSPHTS